MKTRTLGRGLEVSAIGLGCMGLSYGYGPAVDRVDGVALASIDVQGARYPAALQGLVGR